MLQLPVLKIVRPCTRPAHARVAFACAQTDDFEGFDNLKSEDQEQIEQLCKGDLPAAKRPKVDSEEAPADDPNKGHTGFEEAYAKYSSMNVQTLKEYLDVNEQTKTGQGRCCISVAWRRLWHMALLLRLWYPWSS